MRLASKKIIIGILVLAALVAGGGYLWRKNKTPEITYRQIPIRRGPIAITVLSTGTVEPENRIDVKPPIAGRAEQVLIKEGTEVKRGQVLIWMSSTERAALLDAARARGPEELKRWEELYRPTPILAPVSGTVIARSIEPGQTFATTDAILAMSDRLIVQAQVDETDIAQIKNDQSTVIVLDAYPNEKIEARVLKIAYEAKTVNNVTTYVVTVVPKEAPDFMRSGMTANVTFNVSSKEEALLLSTEAIKYRKGEPYVLVPSVDPGGSVEKTLKLGLNDGKQVEVVDGMTEGDFALVANESASKPEAAQQGSNPFGPPSPPRGRR